MRRRGGRPIIDPAWAAMEDRAKDLGRVLERLTKPVGARFVLLLMGGRRGEKRPTTYVSNAEAKAVAATMRQIADRIEGREGADPVIIHGGG